MKTILNACILITLCVGCDNPITRMPPAPKVVYLKQEPFLEFVNERGHKLTLVPIKNMSLESYIHIKTGTFIKYGYFEAYSRYKLEYFLELIQDKNVPLNQK